MVCPKCGKRNKNDLSKCVVCGKKLENKNVKKDGLIDSITSSIDVKAIKKAEKSLVNNIKRLSPKIIVISVCLALLAFLIAFLAVGRGVTCTFKSYDAADGLYYNVSINFNHKKDKITRFSQRIEYSSSDASKKEYLANIYDNMLNDMQDKPNYRDIVKSSLGNRHFSIVYSFSPNYIDNVKDYTPYDFSEYNGVKDFKQSLKDAGFKCR